MNILKDQRIEKVANNIDDVFPIIPDECDTEDVQTIKVSSNFAASEESKMDSILINDKHIKNTKNEQIVKQNLWNFRKLHSLIGALICRKQKVKVIPEDKTAKKNKRRELSIQTGKEPLFDSHKPKSQIKDLIEVKLCDEKVNDETINSNIEEESAMRIRKSRLEKREKMMSDSGNFEYFKIRAAHFGPPIESIPIGYKIAENCPEITFNILKNSLILYNFNELGCHGWFYGKITKVSNKEYYNFVIKFDVRETKNINLNSSRDIFLCSRDYKSMWILLIRDNM